MRWPFRSKDTTEAGTATSSAIVAPREPQYAESVPRTEWALLPPAPIAISTHAPCTVVGSTSAIRRPIGLREHADVSSYAAVGVVEGLAHLVPVSNDRATRPEAPAGAPSALPDVVARTLRAVEGNGATVLTRSESVPVVRPVAEPPRDSGTKVPERAPLAPRDGEVELVNAPRSSLAQSRRLGLGPGYHGPLPDAIRQDRLDRGEDVADDDAPPDERVPDDLRTVIRDAYGHDVGDHVVRRGPEVSEEARQLGAHAFARDGEVFVPIEAGPLDRPEAKSLLAHELTHLVQQRRRSAPLPDEGSPEGRALEAEAQRAERFVRGDAGAPAPGPVTVNQPSDVSTEVADTARFVDELVHRGVAEPDGTGGIRFLWGHGAGGRVQRATEPATPTTTQPGMGSRVWTAVTGTFTDDIEEAITQPWGITLEETAEKDKAGVDEVARKNQRDEIQQKFHTARLEHLKAKKAQEVQGGVLTDADQATLNTDVQKEIDARLAEVTKRTDAQLERVNKHLSDEKQPVRTRLDPDMYDEIFKKLFPNDVDAPMPPADDASTLDENAKKLVAKAKSGATPPGGGVPKAGTATPPGGGAPMGGPTPGGAHNEGQIDSWADVKGSYASEFTELVTSPFGITLTDAERKEIWNPDADRKDATTTPKATPATPGGSGAPTGATPAQTPPHGIDMLDLDRLDLEDLTRRLFQRVRSDLRRELLVDRERAGRLNDMR